MYNNYNNIFHNIYGLIFCIRIVYLSNLILQEKIDNNNTLYDTWDIIVENSFYYFFISGIINILDKSYLYIIHHIISLIAVYYGYIYKEQKYIYWICQNFLSEISSIFLIINLIIKQFKINKYLNSTINFIVKSLFIISYTIVRIIYLIPVNLNYLMNNDFNGIYQYILPICFYMMIGLNIYWFISIYFKLYKMYITRIES